MHEELRLVCREFQEKRLTLEDLIHRLSWVAYPDELKEIMKDANYQLEKIRFITSDFAQYDEALIVVNNILERLNMVAKE